MAQAQLTAELEAQLLDLSQQLLDAIAELDWPTYARLVADDSTCFEPEAVGCLVSGHRFHQTYFDLLASWRKCGRYAPPINTISSPHVRLLGGGTAAVVSYVRLQQKVKDERPVTQRTEETRVWELRDGSWVCVHLHRSTPAAA